MSTQPRPQISILLMGGTGTGKTTFTNLAGGSQFTFGEGLESCTQSVQSHQFPFKNNNITLIDMPGFDHANKSDIDILKDIVDFLVKLHQEHDHRPLHGILYFHRISDSIRTSDAARRNLTMFQKLCGPEAYKSVAIVTTGWDEEEKDIADVDARLVELKNELFKEVLDGHGEIFCHDRSPHSAEKILDHFIGKDAPIPLLIQREFIDEHKELSETAAGEELHHEIMQQLEKYMKEMVDLVQKMEKAIDPSEDSVDPEDLENEYLKLRERMAYWYAASEKLAHSNIRESPVTTVPSVGAMIHSGGQSSSTRPQASRRMEDSLDDGQSSTLDHSLSLQFEIPVTSNEGKLPTTTTETGLQLASSDSDILDPRSENSPQPQPKRQTNLREKNLIAETTLAHTELDMLRNENSELRRKLAEMQRNQEMWERDKASFMRGLRTETKARQNLERQRKYDKDQIMDLEYRLEDANAECIIV